MKKNPKPCFFSSTSSQLECKCHDRSLGCSDLYLSTVYNRTWCFVDIWMYLLNYYVFFPRNICSLFSFHWKNGSGIGNWGSWSILKVIGGGFAEWLMERYKGIVVAWVGVVWKTSCSQSPHFLFSPKHLRCWGCLSLHESYLLSNCEEQRQHYYMVSTPSGRSRMNSKCSWLSHLVLCLELCWSQLQGNFDKYRYITRHGPFPGTTHLGSLTTGVC
jgi:hypothetical protein